MTTRAGWALCALLGTAACGHDEAVDEPIAPFSIEELMKPETCRECHPVHYDEWSGSMHAYAATDPVFIAMNARGQAETAGKLGDFCVSCHAPMAVRTGATTDGLNLAELPSELGGVTCYFCHNVASVDGTHNAMLTLAMDQRMRGGIKKPVPNRAHRSAYSPLMDSMNVVESSSLCGACHDIVTSTDFAPAPVELERTYQEWQGSVFNNPDPSSGVSCTRGCHMVAKPNQNVADAPNVFPRTRHDHQFPGIDVALTEFPQRESQLEAIRRVLDPALRSEICVARVLDTATIRVRLENQTGHAFPSGAAQDRRVWVEVIASRGEQRFAAGVVPDGVPATVAQAADPANFWLMRDVVHDEQGHEAHMFWDVAKVVAKATLPPLERGPDAEENFEWRDYAVFDQNGRPFVPERVTLRVRVQPIGLDVIDDLIASEYDPGVREAMPTFDVLPLRSLKVSPQSPAPWPQHLTLEWTPELAANPNFGFEEPQPINGVKGARCVGQSKRGR